MRFFVGLHQPHDAQHFERAFISVNRLRTRKSGFAAKQWIMDSGAFSVLATHGQYPEGPEAYAAEIRRWAANGELLAAVAQDYMCEPVMLERTGMSIAEHQALTIERYDRLIVCDTGGVPIIPVLQGWCPGDYVDHLRAYAGRIPYGAWVGVGSVCKRNVNTMSILLVLDRIKHERPDLKLHGFGLKKTALSCPMVRALLHSADSMAWSFAARRDGGNGNDWRMAKAFEEEIA